ncbi:hypothetical protein [Metaclostridioides mangenotii]|uniref:hypothetical protein n=1 Tax=Metaclostridioides mangenotii TaxID=1540 RepID=UPI000465B9A8|nr:hypothetical protein [Clostridioides mangenotii]
MKENIKGFWNLLCLIVSCLVCIAGFSEIIHLLAIKEYLLSVFIIMLVVFFFCLGVDSYGIIKNQIKNQ